MALLALILVLVIAAVSEQTLVVVPEEVRTVANANNDFTTKFAQYLKEASPKENAVFSPVSASSVLAGLAEGAAGTTRSELLTALSLTDNDQLIRSGYRTIITSYDSYNGNVTLNMADAFFVAEDFTPKTSFVSMMRSDFKSEVETLNFAAGSTAVNKINSWVSQHTNGRIDKLYSEGDLSASTLLVLANAVYFKGTWKVSFNKGSTSKQKFYLSSKESTDVDMMTVTSSFVVYSDDTLQANVLEIPYSGEQMKMVIVLPYKTDGLETTLKNLKSIPKPKSNDYAEQYKISVPKFKITSNIDVREMLQSLGVRDAFSSSADFSQLSSRRIVVDSVKQKAFVEVNEEGTEAAAATGGGGLPGPSPSQDPPEFTVDHPFLYFIVHVPTETSVFAGYTLSP